MFLYFVPTHRPSLKRCELPAELAHAFDADPKCAAVVQGPAGRGGVILAAEAQPRLGYFPSEQAWKPLPNSDCLIGHSLTPDPRSLSPASFVRPEILPGKDVVDSLGRRWHIPYATNYVEFEQAIWPMTNLPQRLTLNESGQWVRGNVVPRYAPLWELVQAYGLALTEAVLETEAAEGDLIRFTFERVDQLAIEALSVNYRLGPVECDLLELYDETIRQAIIDTARGLPLLAALKKKRGPSGGDLSPPAGESMPASLPDSPPSNGSTTPPANIGSPK